MTLSDLDRVIGAVEACLECMDHEAMDADPPDARTKLHDARDDAHAALTLLRQMRENAVEGCAEKDEWWANKDLPEGVFYPDQGDGEVITGTTPALLILTPEDNDG